MDKVSGNGVGEKGKKEKIKNNKKRWGMERQREVVRKMGQVRKNVKV